LLVVIELASVLVPIRPDEHTITLFLIVLIQSYNE
jgi:hypothetical protein